MYIKAVLVHFVTENINISAAAQAYAKVFFTLCFLYSKWEMRN